MTDIALALANIHKEFEKQCGRRFVVPKSVIDKLNAESSNKKLTNIVLYLGPNADVSTDEAIFNLIKNCKA